MALRTYYSPVSGNKSSVPWTGGLDAFLTSATTVRPLAIAPGTDADEPSGDIIEAVLQQDSPGGEVLHRLYAGPAIPLKLFIAQLANDAVRAGALTPLTFVAEKGMQLLFTPDGMSQLGGALVWNFCSDCGGSSGTSDSMESEAG
jgi:hypothetical protein